MSLTSNPSPPRSSPNMEAHSDSHSMSGQTSSQSTPVRRSRPGHVQTSVPTGQLVNSVPPSAISSSSVASSSQHGSPILSPDAVVGTNSSSIQPSPEPPRGRDIEQFPPAPFSLGDPLLEPYLSRKTSINSMATSSLAGPSLGGAMAEAMQSSGGKGLMRRLSSRAAQRFSRNRRQSSATPQSRDGSVGPGILRRRSDSNNTGPPVPETVLFTDSDEDIVDDKDRTSFSVTDGQIREVSSTSHPGSVGSALPINPPAGPVIPLALIKGTHVLKVSKRKKYKEIFLVFDADAAKITWKNRSLKSIYIDDIREIRMGPDTRQYRLDFDVADSDEGRFFTILYAVPDKSKSKVMHVLTRDEETFTSWVTALDAISKHRHDMMTSLMAFNDKAVRAFWSSEMIKQFDKQPHSVDEEEIDLPGVERVCRNLHIHVTPKDIQIKFAMADTTRTGRLNFLEFQAFIREMKRRADIRTIYRATASDNENGVSWPEFCLFLREVQGEDVDSDPPGWEAKFARFARRPRLKIVEEDREVIADLRMSEQALAAYLTSPYNGPLARGPEKYTMDRPMNEYFISSSHNTYLLGRQVADESSVEGYISALVKGCRSVEIDCWDGSDGQPQVEHGYAFTNAISFREVIKTVNKYAFVSSPFPLWVSLEVHCGPAQQEIMTEIMKEVFGSALVTEMLDPSADKIPSPSELLNRILIKVKSPEPEDQKPTKAAAVHGRRRGNSLNSPYTKPVALDNSTVPAQYLPHSPMLNPKDSSRRAVGRRYYTITEGEVAQDATGSSSSEECETSGNEGSPYPEVVPRPEIAAGNDILPAYKKTSKITAALGALAIYSVGISYDGYRSLESKVPFHIISFMEGKFDMAFKSKPSKDAVYLHNMRHMMRVYPQYTRFSSANFNPVLFWRKGVQMSAMNWQTFDLGMQLNVAMFEGGTDQSGYVLKPQPMREIRHLHNMSPEEVVTKLERKNVTFSIDVISAQQLMRPASLSANRAMDTYVEVEVFHANDKRSKKDGSVHYPVPTDSPLSYRTPVVRENGFNPIFDSSAFLFDVTTKYPELIFIRWSVKLSHDSTNTNDRAYTLATFTAKLSSMKQGYRTLPLLDSNGDRYLFSTLFCNIKIGPTKDVFVTKPGDGTESAGAFKRLNNRVFNRSSNNYNSNTLKLSSEKSSEKASIDSGYSDSSQPSTTKSVQ